MTKHLATKAFSWPRWLLLVTFVAGLCALAVFGSAERASAVNLPGVEVCPKNAPFANTPEAGLAGLLGERPLQITTGDDPHQLWSTAGFAGLDAHTYDLGCALDPTTWVQITNANAESHLANFFLSANSAMVSLSDSIDRRAWQPGWVTSFLADFADRATGTINDSILVTFLGLGLGVATIILLWRAKSGDMSGTATDVGWAFVVLTISALLLVAPMAASSFGQRVGGAAVSVLNQGANASDSVTNQVAYNVQYQGWLRRNFGSVDSAVAKQYGPKLLASTRVSWAELDAINALPVEKQSDAREKVSERKASDFKDIAQKIEDEDSTAYRYLTGKESSSGEAIVESAFILSATTIRLAVSILMITCAIVLVLLAIFWLVLTPVLPQPKVGRTTGRDIGMGLVNNGVSATRIVLEAALASWLFGIYLQACMKPGMSLWWALLLLLIGTGITWAVLGPIAKFKSIVTFGRTDGHSIVGRLLKGYIWSYVGGRIGGRAAAAEINEHQDEQQQERAARSPEPQVVQATIYNPTPAFVPERATHVDGEGLPTGSVRGLPGGVYERGPNPPRNDRFDSPYRPYERSDDNEGANA